MIENQYQNPLIQLILTPRSAPCCSVELMKSLAEMAKEFDIPIQSHICEQKPAIEYTLKLFPEHGTCADVFDKTNLLTKKVRMINSLYNNIVISVQ